MDEPNLSDYRLDDGMYVQPFIISGGRRYNLNVLTIKEITNLLVNSTMDGVGKLFGVNDKSNDNE